MDFVPGLLIPLPPPFSVFEEAIPAITYNVWQMYYMAQPNVSDHTTLQFHSTEFFNFNLWFYLKID